MNSQTQSHRSRQLFLVLALSLIGVGNLIVPPFSGSSPLLDYLLLSLGLCGLIALYRLKTVIARLGIWLPGLGFVMLCIPGFLVTPINGYGVTKAQALLVVLILFFVCAAIQSPPAFMKRLTLITIFTGTVFSLAAQSFGTLDVGGRLVFLGLNPIGIGRITGLVLVMSLTLLFIKKASNYWTVIALVVVAAITTVGVVATGSRGPLLSAAVACAGLVFLLSVTKKLSPRTAFLIALAATAAVGAVLLSDSTGLTRLATATDSGRGELYAETFRLALDNPQGIGWGQLGQYIVDFRAIDEESLYAHNVFLEILVEGGVVALLAFTLLLAGCIAQAWRAAKNNSWFVVNFVVLVYAVTSAQFSSDIVGNRLMWLYMALSLAAGSWVNRELRSEHEEIVPGNLAAKNRRETRKRQIIRDSN